MEPIRDRHFRWTRNIRKLNPLRNPSAIRLLNHPAMRHLAHMPRPAAGAKATRQARGRVAHRSLARDWRRWSRAERVGGVALAFVVIAGNVAGIVGGALL